MIDDTYGLIDSIHIELFENLLRKYGNGTVLDLGSGPRNPRGNKSELVKKLICVDGSEYVKQEMNKEILPENCSFVLSDICNLPFKENYADLVLMIGIYTALPHKMPDIDLKNKTLFQEYVNNTKDEMLKEAHRVLKPTGYIIASLKNSMQEPIEKQIKEFNAYFDIVKVHEGERYLLEATYRD